MKNRLLSIVIMGLMSLHWCVQAVPVYNLISGITTEKSAPNAPVIDVVPTNTGYQVTVNIEEICLREDSVYKGRYFVDINDFVQTIETTKPSLPEITKVFMLPDGVSPTIQITSTQYTDLSRQLAPARPPLLEFENDYTKSTLPDIKASLGFTTNAIASVGDVFTYRGKKFFRVVISPVRFSKASGIVRVFKNYTFNINFQNTPTTEALFYANFDNWESDVFWKNNFTNEFWSDDLVLIDDGNIAKDFLILTNSEFDEAAQVFIDWKKQEGYNCYIITVDDLSAEQIKDEIIYFAGSHPQFYSLMIVGDSSVIPSWRQTVPESVPTYRDDYFSDRPYACLDNDQDTFPDVLYGRIPVTSLEDAYNAINKIIAYERYDVINTYPNFIPQLYKALHVGYFQVGDKEYTKECRPFILRSENLIKKLTPLGVSINRMYYANSVSNPLSLYDGSSLPSELQKPQYSWSWTPANIISAINGRVNYVWFTGHGLNDGWYGRYISERFFDTDNVKSMNNRLWQPIVISTTCSTGENLVDTSFAARLLNYSSNAGASGVFAASRVSYTFYDRDYWEILFKYLYSVTDEKESFPSWCTIGDATNYTLQVLALNGYNAYTDMQAKMYHWFGDPTMRIPTAKPSRVTGIGISSLNGMTNVTCSEDNIQITGVYSNGKVKSYRSNSAYFLTSGCEYIVIIGKNKIPQKVTLNGETDFEYAHSTYLKSVCCNNNNLNVTYRINSADIPSYVYIPSASGTLTITSITGQVMGSYQCPYDDTHVVIDCSSYPSGTYIASFNVYNTNGGSATFIKQ